MQQASTAMSETRLPRAVLRRSKVIEDRLKAQQEPNADLAGDTPPAETPSEPPATPVDVSPPAAPTPPPGPAADPRESDPAYWKQRFKVTEGVLRAEREARRAEADGLHQRLNELQEKVRTLQASSTPATKTDIGKYFTPEQVEQLGEAECEAMAATAERAVADKVQAAIDAQVQPLRDEQQRREQQHLADKKREFVDKLIGLCPDYVEIDESDGWIEWLKAEDDTSGLQRQLILDRHIAGFNAVRTAKMFEDYRATLPKPPAPPVAPHGTGAPSGGEPPPQNTRLMPATDKEVREWHKARALGKKVSQQERVEFEARMKLRAGR